MGAARPPGEAEDVSSTTGNALAQERLKRLHFMLHRANLFMRTDMLKCEDWYGSAMRDQCRSIVQDMFTKRRLTSWSDCALAVGAKVVLNLGCHTVSPLALADFTIDFDPE